MRANVTKGFGGQAGKVALAALLAFTLFPVAPVWATTPTGGGASLGSPSEDEPDPAIAGKAGSASENEPGADAPDPAPQAPAGSSSVDPGIPSTSEAAAAIATNATVSIRFADGYPTGPSDIWTNGGTPTNKTLVVTADFGDATSSGKTLTVSIPRGLKWISIPVVEGKYVRNQVGEGRLRKIESSDPLYSAIDSVDLSGSKAAIDFSREYAGSIVYTFSPGTQKVELSFSANVDNYLLRNPDHELQGADVWITKGSQGTVAQSSTGPLHVGNHQGSLVLISEYGTSYAPQAIATEAEDVGYAYGYRYKRGWPGIAVRTKGVVVLHYPKNMHYESVIGETSYIDQGAITYDDTKGEARIPFSVFYGQDITVKYSIPEGTSLGVYEVTEQDYAEVEYFDGFKETLVIPFPAGESGYRIEVVSRASMVDKVRISDADEGRYANPEIGESFVWAPLFAVDNAENPGSRLNRSVEFQIDPKFKAVSVNVPFDMSLVGNALSDVQFKTNRRSGWQTSSLTTKDTLSIAGVARRITKKMLGLASDEYLTAVKCNVGTFSSGYNAGASLNSAAMIGVYGQLDSSAAEAAVTLSIYDEGNRAGTEVSKTGYVKRAADGSRVVYNYSSSYFVNSNGTTISSLTAGGVLTLRSEPRNHVYHITNTVSAFADPVLYLRQVPGMGFRIDALKVEQVVGTTVEEIPSSQYEVTRTKANDGTTVYKVKFKPEAGARACSYEGEDLRESKVRASVDVQTDPKMAGGSFSENLFYWDAPNVDRISNGVEDVYDVDGDGDTREGLGGAPTQLTVLPNKRVLMSTYLSLAGEDPSAGYVEGDDSTVARFTPGTAADYAIELTNNGESEAQAFGVYVPIPKRGVDFGSGFQDAPFEWDMKLSGPIDFEGADASMFDVLYSTNADASTYSRIDDPAIYSATPPADLSQVKIVAVRAKAALPAGFTAKVRIPLAIDETIDSAQGKIGTRNVYNPRYSVDSAAFTGELPATRVGAELVITRIAGRAFVDVDSNGLDGAGDSPLAGHRIDLYKLDGAMGAYAPAVDAQGVPVSAQTAVDGSFAFDDAQGVAYGTYALKFADLPVGERWTVYAPGTEHGSHVINAPGVPAQGDDYTGWILGIDPTVPEAVRLNAGVVSYDPAKLAITGVDAAYQVKRGLDLTLVAQVEPSNFASLGGALSWKLDDPADSQYVDLFGTASADLRVLAKAIPADGHTVGITLTATDPYGTVRTARTDVTILVNGAPVITAPSVVELGVGKRWDALDPSVVSGLAVSDDHDKALSVDDFTVAGDAVPVDADGKLNQAGTYLITYSVTDSDGNASSADTLVKVSGVPYLVEDDDAAAGNIGSDAAVDLANLPPKRVRLGASTDPFEGYRAFYPKAADAQGADPLPTEILPDGTQGGSVAVVALADSDGNPISSIAAAGKYGSLTRVESAAGTSVEFGRGFYVRSGIAHAANPVAIRDDAKRYATLADFLAAYPGIALEASVQTPDADGNVFTVALDPSSFSLAGSKPMSDYSFERSQADKDDKKPLSVTLRVLVKDETAATSEPYPDASVEVTLSITVQDVIGDAPSIVAKPYADPTERLSTDKVLADPYAVSTPEAYEAALDLLVEGNHTDTLTFYNKLMADVDIADGPIAQAGSGIAEKGIVSIVRLGALEDSSAVETLVANDAEARANQDVLMRMYTEPGHYEVLYYAVDNDGNRVELSRHIHTSGPTEFASDLATGDAPASAVNVRASAGAIFSPGGVLASHMDYDGTGTHETSVVSPGPVDVSAPGTSEIVYTTSHHVATYPETDIVRVSDKFTQHVLAHGAVKLSVDGTAIELFADQEAALPVATAVFEKAVVPTALGAPDVEEVSLAVADDANASNGALPAPGVAGVRSVVFTADDGLGLPGSTVQATKDYRYWGLPELSVANSEITIGENATKADVAALVGASASVEAPDNTPVAITPEIDFDGFASAGDVLAVRASYHLGGTERTASAEVKLTKVSAPKLTARDARISVGDELDIAALTSLAVEHAYLTADDVRIFHGIPATGGKAAHPGTYRVSLSATDREGNAAALEVNVMVDGLPTLNVGTDLNLRVGNPDSLETGVSATYLRAVGAAGVDPVDTPLAFGSDGIRIARIDEIGADGTRTQAESVSKLGAYEVAYEARTPAGATASAVRSVLVHGLPAIEARSIGVRVGESPDRFLERFAAELSVSATVERVRLDGGAALSEVVDLAAAGKVSIDLSKVDFTQRGSYPAMVSVVDEGGAPAVPSAAADKRIMVEVGEFQGEPPVVLARDLERMSSDPLMFPEGGASAYLVSLIQAEAGDYPVSSVSIASIERKPDKATLALDALATATIDPADPAALTAMMRERGGYRVVYAVEDAAGNVVRATSEIGVWGPVELDLAGREPKSVEIRQAADASWDGRGGEGFQVSPTGERVALALRPANDASLAKVGVVTTSLVADAFPATLENGTPRPAFESQVRLLVHGVPVIEAPESVEVPEGASLEDIVRAVGAKAFFDDALLGKVDLSSEVSFGEVSADGRLILSVAYDDAGKRKTVERVVRVSTAEQGAPEDPAGPEDSDSSQVPGGSADSKAPEQGARGSAALVSTGDALLAPAAALVFAAAIALALAVLAVRRRTRG